MAIVRMVNGISDKAQKGKSAVSVSSNAAAAGMFAVISPHSSILIDTPLVPQCSP